MDDTLQVLLKVAENTPSPAVADIEDIESKASIEAQLQMAELHDRNQKRKLQIIWSRIIGTVLIVSIIGIWSFLYGIGIGWLDYSKYPGLTQTVVGAFFAEVVGLGLVVAKYLFPSNK